MKKIFLIAVIFSLAFASCSKNDSCNYSDSTVTASASEIAGVQSYITTNGITGTQQHPSGFFYKITQAGTGKAIVNLCSNVLVKYAGRLTNGTYFDPLTPGTTSSAEFTLGQVIPGWQKGLPLISAGGKITLYIPPSLGYGSNPPPGSNIPPNSILIFDIELISVS